MLKANHVVGRGAREGTFREVLEVILCHVTRILYCCLFQLSCIDGYY